MARTPTMIQPHPSHNSRCSACGTLHPLNVHWSHSGGPHTGAASHAYFKKRAGIPASESPRGRGGRKKGAKKGSTRAARPAYGPMTAAQDWDARFASTHKRIASHHCPDGDCGHPSHGHSHGRMAAEGRKSGYGKKKTKKKAEAAPKKRKTPTASKTKASPKKSKKVATKKEQPKTKTINMMKLSAADRAAVSRCLARVKTKKK